MEHTLTLEHLTHLWEACSLKYALLPLQNGVSVMVSERGGRVFGPFLSASHESIFWLNPALASLEGFQALLAKGDWNTGGDRFWIGPEVQYIYQDRRRQAETAVIPAAMDPGNFRLEASADNALRLTNDFTLNAYNIASGEKRLRFDMLVRPVEDPLRALSAYPELTRGVTYAGYEQTVQLQEERCDEMLSAAWNVIELYPGGEVFVPVAEGFEVTNYELQPVGDAYQRAYPGYVSLKITGDRAYKVGYKAAQTSGRFGYYHERDGAAYLVLRAFTNNPSSIYFEEPCSRPGAWGSSVFVYNDDGSYGGYGEIECLGQTIGGSTGRSSATDTFSLWFYSGAPESVRRIASQLLMITPFN